MILFYVVFGILLTGTLVGLLLENKGVFKIPEDEVMARFVKLEAYRAKKKKELSKNVKQ